MIHALKTKAFYMGKAQMLAPALLSVLLGVLYPAVSNAATSGANFKTLRAEFQHNADRCDLIHVEHIVQIQAMPVKELRKQEKDLLELLKTTKELRQTCYEEAKNQLEDVMAEGLAESQDNPDDTALTLQLELDEQLPEILGLRQKISGELLDSIAADLTYTIKNERKLSRKKKGGTLYLVESDKTASLIKQDMGIVLSAEGRQLQLDELLTPPVPDNLETFVRLKLKKAMHYLARTMLLYEDIQADKRYIPVILAKLRSEYLYAAGQLNELMAMDPQLESFSDEARPNMQQIINRAQLLELDIEGALRDYRNKALEEDLNNWLSELYQDLSQLSLALKTQLQWYGLKAQVVEGDENLPDIPADLEAFIEKAQQAKEKEAKAQEAAAKAAETKAAETSQKKAAEAPAADYKNSKK